MEKTFDLIVSHAKKTGFVFQGSEIYGGLSNTWDYGPYGVNLKDNIKRAWQKKFIQEDINNIEIQAAILMNPKVWEASGHLKSFSDPLMDCKECKTRHRADQLIENFSKGEVTCEGWSNEEMEKYIEDNNVPCPDCGKHNFTSIRQFNLMFKTFQGTLDDAKSTIYLRPETAQGMFVDFKNVQRAYRKKLPFGIGQIGKSFRNEITPGNFIFRTREFEQMECEYFAYPDKASDLFNEQLDKIQNFVKNIIRLNPENYRLKEHDKNDLSHYSSRTVDIEYKYPHGFSEL